MNRYLTLPDSGLPSPQPHEYSLCSGRFDAFALYTTGVCCLITRRGYKMEACSSTGCVQRDLEVLHSRIPLAFVKSLSRITSFAGKAT